MEHVEKMCYRALSFSTNSTRSALETRFHYVPQDSMRNAYTTLVKISYVKRPLGCLRDTASHVVFLRSNVMLPPYFNLWGQSGVFKRATEE